MYIGATIAAGLGAYYYLKVGSRRIVWEGSPADGGDPALPASQSNDASGAGAKPARSA